MAREQAIESPSPGRIGIHNVMASATVDVNVDKSRSQNGLREVNYFDTVRKRASRLRRDLNNSVVFNQKAGTVHVFERGIEAACEEGNQGNATRS